MSSPRSDDARPADDSEPIADGERRVVFDDDDAPVLPDSTRDDTDEGWGERPSQHDDWLREQRPPHWD